MELTGIHDTDVKVLLHLDDKSLTALCSSNQHAQKLCSDPYLWYQKITNVFPDFPLNNKITGRDYQMIYNYLINIRDNRERWETGRKLIKWSRTNNHVEIQDWWIEHLDDLFE
jgi:hypothetical protein